MSNFTIMIICLVILAFIGRNCLFIDDPELRNNKGYNIFIICSGLIALILVIVCGFNFIKLVLSIINFFKDIL